MKHAAIYARVGSKTQSVRFSGRGQAMDEAKREAPEEAGFKVGDAAEFLGLTPGKRPDRLEFRLEGGKFRGFDPDGARDYLIKWCGNGGYSHYILEPIDDPEGYHYVFISDRSDLLRSIEEAEKRLVYGVGK